MDVQTYFENEVKGVIEEKQSYEAKYGRSGLCLVAGGV